MQIGVTGHQNRPGIDWPWVKNVMRSEMIEINNVSRALSSLAEGSDQLFASVALSLSIPVLAVVPMAGYERFFNKEALANYAELLKQCEVVNLDWKGDDSRGFYEAGKFIAEESDVLLAIWDGKHSKGLGGTADVVEYAASRAKSIVHINPVTLEISRK